MLGGRLVSFSYGHKTVVKQIIPVLGDLKPQDLFSKSGLWLRGAELGRAWLNGSASLGYIHSYVYNLLASADLGCVDLVHVFLISAPHPPDHWVFLMMLVEVQEGKPNHANTFKTLLALCLTKSH